MLKTTKWKHEKNKIKAVFRLQFHATRIPRVGWDKLCVSFIPAESGKVMARTKKSNVRNGSCKWADPIYETTRLLQDSKTKKCEDKIYKVVVAMGMSRSGVLGEAEINIAEFYEASKPVDIALPLPEYGSVLHVTIQLLTSKTGFREFEQQNEMREMSFVKSSSSSSDDPFPLHILKENTDVEDYSESEIRSNGLNCSPQSLQPDHEAIVPDSAESSLLDIHGVVKSLEKSVTDIENSACSFKNNLALESTSRNLLSKQEFQLSNTQQDLEFLEISKQAPRFSESRFSNNQQDLEFLGISKQTPRFSESQLSNTQQDLEFLGISKQTPRFSESQLSNTQQDLKFLEISKQTPRFSESRLSNTQHDLKFLEISHQIPLFSESQLSNTQHDLKFLEISKQTPCFSESQLSNTQHGLKFLEISKQTPRFLSLVSVEDGLMELHKKALFAEDDIRGSFCPDIDTILETLRNFKIGFEKEQGILESRIHDLEREFGYFMQKTGEMQRKMAAESNILRNEYSTCIYTVSSAKSEVEDTNRRILGLLSEREELISMNEEFERRAVCSEESLRAVRQRYSVSVGRLQSDLELLSLQVSSMFENGGGVREPDAEEGISDGISREKIENLEQEILQLRARSDSEILEVGRLGSEIERFEEESRKLKEENKSLRIRSDFEILEVGQENARLLLEVGRLGSRIEQLEEESLQLKEENKGLRIRSDFEILEVGRLGSEIERFEEESLQLKEENRSLRISSDFEIPEVGRLGSEIERFEEENLQLKEENKSLRIRSDFEILEVGEENARLLLEVGDLGFQIERLREENGRLISEIENQRFENTEFLEKISTLHADYVYLEEAVEFKTKEATTYAIILDILTEKITPCSRFENQPLDDLITYNIILEVRGTVLEAELNVQISDLSVKLSEQILEAEQLRKISSRKEPAHETLRIALMKEEYEGRIENLENRLLDSRNHGGEILLKLQEAAEEVEKRKKTEASESRKNEELRAVLKAETSSRRLEVCEEEKRILETFLKQCREELHMLRRPATESVGGSEGVEKKVENEFGEALFLKSTMDRLHFQLEMLIKENDVTDLAPTMSLDDNNEVGPTKSGSRDIHERMEREENEVASALSSTNHSSEKRMEKELIEMQERYSKLSLLFAQVEGERQLLVLTLKNLTS